jgi:hypothetical protein
MKLKHSLLIFLLVVSLVSFYSCRNKVDQPSPTGPSTFSVLLIASASPNLLVARDNGQRDTCDITVRLVTFQGTALSNETIILDIYDTDQLVTVENYGYFEGNDSVAVRTTDSEGKIRVRYYGPSLEEVIFPNTDPDKVDQIISSPTLIHIRASLAWQGKEMINDFAPVQVIVEDVKRFRLRVEPNVLWVTDGNIKSRQASFIATLETLGGAPVKGQKVWFEFQRGPGEFKENGRTKISARTNENGEAIVTYLSPKRGDISMSETVVVEAQLETGDPNWSHDTTLLVVNRGD